MIPENTWHSPFKVKVIGARVTEGYQPRTCNLNSPTLSQTRQRTQWPYNPGMMRYYILWPLTTSNYGILQPRIGSPQFYQCYCPWHQWTVAALDSKSPSSYSMIIIKHQVDHICQWRKFISIMFIPKCVPQNIYLWLWLSSHQYYDFFLWKSSISL